MSFLTPTATSRLDLVAAIQEAKADQTAEATLAAAATQGAGVERTAGLAMFTGKRRTISPSASSGTTTRVRVMASVAEHMSALDAVEATLSTSAGKPQGVDYPTAFAPVLALPQLVRRSCPTCSRRPTSTRMSTLACSAGVPIVKAWEEVLLCGSGFVTGELWVQVTACTKASFLYYICGRVQRSPQGPPRPGP